MGESAEKLVRVIDDRHLALFAGRVRGWLLADLSEEAGETADFSESRARALLRATNTLDDVILHDFARLMGQDTAVRLALFDLLNGSGLAENEEITALAAVSAVAETAAPEGAVPWLSLAMAAFAWKSGYPLHQLDPASPPGPYSPAGQTVRRTAQFIRQQAQRSATEREQLGRKLAYDPAAVAPGAPALDELPAQAPIPPLPPHFRPPIPVNYPEVSPETVQVEAEETMEVTAVTRGEPIVITAEDLEGSESTPLRQPSLQITADQAQTPSQGTAVSSPRSRVVTPNATAAPRTSFADSVRKSFGRGREAMKTTKLRVVVQEYPDGPPLCGLQVRVSCKGIKSHVAGATTREGTFICELPVPLRSGLTYDVDVTWPRDLDGETERKSITLNADRTLFTLPFYHRHAPPVSS